MKASGTGLIGTAAERAGISPLRPGQRFFETDTLDRYIVNEAGDAWVQVDGDKTRTVFVPCVGGWNATDGVNLGFNAADYAKGFALPDNKQCLAMGFWAVPARFASSMSVKATVIPNASGDVMAQNAAIFGADGEVYNQHTQLNSGGTSVAAVVINKRNAIHSISMSLAASGDEITLQFYRDGTHVSDTIGDVVSFPGWKVTYTADS